MLVHILGVDLRQLLGQNDDRVMVELESSCMLHASFRIL